MDPTSILYALSTLAQTCAALAAFVGAVGLYRLQILRDQDGRAEFEYRARIQQVTGHDTHPRPIKRVRELAADIPETDVEHRRYVAEADAAWQGVAPRIQCTIDTLVVFELWILFVILASLGGLAHVPALTGWRWSPVALWTVAIMTVVVTGGALFVWLEVWQRLRAIARFVMANA